MKRIAFLGFILLATTLYAQQTPAKFALVIGNGNYTGISKLNNPVNDANDMETALRALGFTVDKVLNGSLDDMERAVENLKRRLSGSQNTYGFFFYAGHGVQASGDNFLIPVEANINSEAQLRQRAVSLQYILDSMNEARNTLNMVVLDACRDNPFGWSRSGTRGLGVVTSAPSGSIVMYATGANSVAQDGTGRNGLFTGYLLNNIKTPGLSVFEVFDRTMGDVSKATNGAQHPELSLKFPGATSAYLGTKPTQTPSATPVLEVGGVTVTTGSLQIHTNTAGIAQIVGNSINQSFEMPAQGERSVQISVGNYEVIMYYEDGTTERKRIEVGHDGTQKLEFNYRPAPTTPSIPSVANPPRPGVGGGTGNHAQLRSVGVFLGTTFATPLLVATVNATYSPINNMFIEVGVDAGMLTELSLLDESSNVDYYSVYPFIHVAYLLPLSGIGDFYVGAGVGYMLGTYDFPNEGQAQMDIFCYNFTAGIIVMDFINISYTARVAYDFATASNKLAIGYVLRY